jgi:hypothetical protein
MVQQLDGTVNEWGWCKQKVYNHYDFFGLSPVVFLETVLTIHFMLIAFP